LVHGQRDFSPAGVELNKAGFPFLGAGVDDLANRYVAALVHRRRKHRINSFVSAADASRTAAMTSTARNGSNMLERQPDGLSTRAVSDLDRAGLPKFFELVQMRRGGLLRGIRRSRKHDPS